MDPVPPGAGVIELDEPPVVGKEVEAVPVSVAATAKRPQERMKT